MVRDGSSGSDDTGEPDEARAADPGEMHDVPNQLTQELARLLAASIAQSQGGKGFPLGVPTGSDLASLASLVSTASGHRTLAPVFKDGLSALAYGPSHGSRPDVRPAQILAPAAPEPPVDDEPMPIPSTWREPGSYDDDRWFRQQLGATLLGLFAGLLVVVPAVLWLSGWIGPERTAKAPAASAPARAASSVARPAEGKVEARPRTADAGTAQYVTGSVDSRGSIEVRRPEPPAPIRPAPPVPATQPVAAPPPAPAPKVDDQRAQIEEIVTRAMQRAENGDLMGAREMLAAAEGAAPEGTITFALAETYDPNKLAAWGTRDVAADAVKARSLYTKALNLGMTRAQTCLDALKP